MKCSVQGFDMDTVTDDALRKRVLNTTIFTRFSPDQKNRIIEALKANHRAVGYMGDGINDAPSLKAADIGISVNTATDVAKESADIILTKKNLLVLKQGILEGRKTFGNTMKYVQMGLSESLATQILVVFIIRTQTTPFFKSKPSVKLILSALLCLIPGWLLPYLPFAHKIGFEILPFRVIAYIIVLVIAYLLCAELVKHFIYRHFRKQ